MKLLGYKASLALSTIAIAGLSIATSTTTTKAASLQATTGISTVFDNCYSSYTRSFKDSGQLLSNSTKVSGDSFTFIYSSGQRLYLGTLGSNSTAYDFNNFELVGSSTINAGLVDALRDRNTQMQDKGSFGSYFSGSIVCNINLGEQVRGELESSDDAFLSSDSKKQEFDGIGANGALLLGNSSGNYRCGKDVALFYR